MIDALGTPQCLLLLGGTSDIAVAVAEQYLARRPLTVVLAGRSAQGMAQVGERLESAGAQVFCYAFDASDPTAHAATMQQVFADHEIDIAVVAFGQLGDQRSLSHDATAAAALAQVNYVGAVSAGVALAERMRAQGHGVIVALSSVAGERARQSNYVYGSTKAGMDAFYQGLSDDLVGTGVRVLVVRPGFVRTKMTAGLEPAPLSTTPQAVAAAIESAVVRGKHTVWVPAGLRYVMSGLRHTPRSLFRRLPL